MGFRISRELKIWVEAECGQAIGRAYEKEKAPTLLAFERQGKAYRSLNRRGDVMWKATPNFLEELAGAEREVDAEYANER